MLDSIAHLWYTLLHNKWRFRFSWTGPAVFCYSASFRMLCAVCTLCRGEAFSQFSLLNSKSDAFGLTVSFWGISVSQPTQHITPMWINNPHLSFYFRITTAVNSSYSCLPILTLLNSLHIKLHWTPTEGRPILRTAFPNTNVPLKLRYEFVGDHGTLINNNITVLMAPRISAVCALCHHCFLLLLFL